MKTLPTKRKSKEDSDNYSFIFDPLIEPYYIERDQYCYTVKKKNEDGQLSQMSFGHYSRFGAAILRITRLKCITGQNYESIKDYINEWNKLQTTLRTIIDPTI